MDFDAAIDASLSKIEGWVESFVTMLPNLVAALLVVVVFWGLARVVRGVVRRVLDRFTDHGPVKTLVGTLVYLAVLLTGVLVALGILDLQQTVTSILAGLGVVGLALGFAFQDIAANLMSGIVMSIRKPFTDGDLIETGDYFGIVESIDLRSTTVRSPTGQVIRIPNSDVYGNAITNYSVSGERRVDVSCGVSYADDLERAEEVALDAMRTVQGRDEEREPELYWEEFGGSSINFVARFWIRFGSSHAEWLAARSDAIKKLTAAFDEAGISIPYPIRTLDFDDVGGSRLREELGVLHGSTE